MESTLLVSEHPGRSLAIHPNGNTSGRRSGTGSSKSYVLVLEQPKGSSSSTSTSALTARFQPTSTFDGNIYEPMMALPVKGCLGLVQVDGGMSEWLTWWLRCGRLMAESWMWVCPFLYGLCANYPSLCNNRTLSRCHHRLHSHRRAGRIDGLPEYVG